MRVQFPATLATLGAVVAFPHEAWLRHLLVANSTVGLIYMHAEYEALRTKGSRFFGHVFRTPTYFYNIVLNLLMHVVAPLVTPSTPYVHERWWYAYVTFAVALLILDLNAVYPTAHGIQPYVVAYLLVMTVSIVAMSMPTHESLVESHRQNGQR